MLNLYSVLLGGRAKNCNTELHDVVFVVGNSLEETYSKLVNKWFGLTKRLHIDASIKLQYVDGYEIIIHPEKPKKNCDKALYFINFGGYKTGYFGEIHEASFYVASSKEEALMRAKQELCTTSLQQHCDDNLLVNEMINENEMMVDDFIKITTVDNYYIHFHPTDHNKPLNIEAQYRKLDVPEIINQAK